MAEPPSVVSKQEAAAFWGKKTAESKKPITVDVVERSQATTTTSKASTNSEQAAAEESLTLHEAVQEASNFAQAVSHDDGPSDSDSDFVFLSNSDASKSGAYLTVTNRKYEPEMGPGEQVRDDDSARSEGFYEAQSSKHPNPSQVSTSGNHESLIIEDLKNKVSKLERENEWLRSMSSRDGEGYLVDEEEQIRKLQEKTFGGIASARWTPADEQDVIAKLQIMKATMKSTSQMLAKTMFMQPEKFDSTQHRALFYKNLRKVLHCTHEELEGLLAHMPLHKQASTILNALLAHAVYEDIIKPAFVSTGDTQTGRDILAKIYHEIGLVDEKNGHDWRAQTLRNLYPQPGADQNDTARVLRETTEENIVVAGRRAAERFVESQAYYLLDIAKMDRDMKDKLTNIFVGASKLAYSLRTRKTWLEVVHLKDLPVTYVTSDASMARHPLVKHEGGDDKLNGYQIRLVTHPGLRVYGTDDGEDYNISRVWMPAEVWFPTGVIGVSRWQE